MKHYYIYYKHHLYFNEETNEVEHKDKRLSKEMSRWQFTKVVIKEVLITFLICSLLTAMFYFGCIINAADSNYTIFVLCICGLIFYLPGALICFGRLWDYDYYIQDYEEVLINKLFSEEIKELDFLSAQEQLKAEQWRAEHPLEEKCRLAMTKNPNYVADLIKYVKGSNDDHNDTCPYCGSKDTVVQTAKHYNPILMTTEERHRIKCCNCGKILSQDYEENNK